MNVISKKYFDMKFIRENALAIVGFIYMGWQLYRDYKKPFSDSNNLFPVYIVPFITILVLLILIYRKYY